MYSDASPGYYDGIKVLITVNVVVVLVISIKDIN